MLLKANTDDPCLFLQFFTLEIDKFIYFYINLKYHIEMRNNYADNIYLEVSIKQHQFVLEREIQ